MTVRQIAISAGLAVGAIAATTAPVHASPTCYFTAWGANHAYRCGTNVLSADWDGNGQRDEVFFIARDTRIMRVTRYIESVNVSGGKAYELLRTEKRPTGAHRVYAVTAGSRQYYSQNDGGGWSPWYPYTP